MEVIFEIPELTGKKIKSYIRETDPIRHVIVFEGGKIFADCLVRIIIEKKIRITNEDHGHQFGLTSPVDTVIVFNEFIQGKTILEASAKDKVGDLILKIDGNAKIEFINESAGYEPWQIQLESGKDFIAASGGEICTMG